VNSQNKSRLFLTDSELKNILVDYFENCGEDRNANLLKNNWQDYSLSFNSSNGLWFIHNRKNLIYHPSAEGDDNEFEDAIPADYPVD